MQFDKTRVQNEDLLFPELSYQILGYAFEVYNELGSGHDEKFYQKALALSLQARRIEFKEQVHYPLYFKQKVIGRTFLDFLIDGKVIVELKKGNNSSKRNIDQVLSYLKVSNLQLGILINFGSEKVSYKRIVNLMDKSA